MRSRPFRCCAATFLFLGSACLAAQDAALQPRSGFGTDDLHVVVIPFSKFQLWRTDTTFQSTHGPGIGGHRQLTGGTRILIADIGPGDVPNGAELESVDFYVQDSDPDTDREFRGSLCRSWVDLDGTDPDGDCPLDVQTSGEPGNTVIGGDPDVTVRYEFDVDNDGEVESVGYLLFAEFGLNAEQVYGPAMRIRQVRLLYRRQVSPAPTAATFGDVPVAHPFFQFVEALAASGITAGCGSGNYCPDAPLTRGQMAVFLAKALGLHWPAPSAPQ